MIVVRRAAHPGDQRPRLSIRHLALMASLVLTLVSPAVVYAWDSNGFSASDEALLVQLTNQARAAAGQNALVVDPDLTGVARWRSRDMSDGGYFSHQIPPNGTRVFDELKRIGYCYTAAGENIGTNDYPDDSATQMIMSGFMGSPAHRANLLGAGYRKIGIGAFKGPGGTHFWTVLFAEPCAATPKATPKPTPSPTKAPAPTAKPAATPDPTATLAATPVPSPVPTPDPTSTIAPDTLDPAEAASAFATTAKGGGVAFYGPRPSSTPSPLTNVTTATSPGGTGLRVIDLPHNADLVSSIVSSVAGSYFGD